MRVSILRNPYVYSSLMYYIRGDWNKIDDINTIIDPGMNDYILKAIKDIPSGVAKSKIEQVIITHEHFDHAAALSHILKLHKPKRIIAYKLNEGVNIKAFDGLRITIGDEEAVIIHTPGHSHDSICIYAYKSKTLFSGDTPLMIKTAKATYTREYLQSLEKLMRYDIKTIYSGHDPPITVNANEIIRDTYEKVRKSKII